MDRGVLYLNFGQAMVVPLCVSLFTLRQHYHGPVAIAAETKHCLEGIENDSRLQPLQVAPHSLLDNTADQFAKYTVKLHTKTLSPFQDTVFIDSDTLIVGKIDELFPQTAGEVVFTARNNSYSTGAAMRLRIYKYWRSIAPELALPIYHDRTYKLVSPINTGIYSLGRDCQAFIEHWHKLALPNPMHSVDEMVAQMIYKQHPHRLIDYRFNANMKNDRILSDVRIWHGPRNDLWKATSPHRDVWIGYYRRAIERNIGNIRDFANNFNSTHRVSL